MRYFENAKKKVSILFRRIRLQRLYNKYGFEKWHLVPTICKPYVNDIISFINNNKIDGYIVEIGCGLCDILGKINTKEKMGVDMSTAVLNAAKHLYPQIEYKEGSFDDIVGINIDTLIAVNFTHNISDEDMITYLHNLLTSNTIKRIILDEVYGEGYRYKHDYLSILQKINPQIVIEKEMGPYESAGFGERKIYIFKIV